MWRSTYVDPENEKVEDAIHLMKNQQSDGTLGLMKEAQLVICPEVAEIVQRNVLLKEFCNRFFGVLLNELLNFKYLLLNLLCVL